MFSVTPISSSLEGMPFLGESSSGASELEWPEEVVGLLEVSTAILNFIYKVFDACDSVLAERSFNEGVVGQRNSLFIDFSVSSLVDKFLNGFSRWVTELLDIYPKVL